MNVTNSSSFTLQDLGMAYRKAKVDLFYSPQVSLFAIADYEEKLSENLLNLLEKLNSTDESWIEDPHFLGGWTLTTKSMDWPPKDTSNQDQINGLIFSSAKKNWKRTRQLLEKNTEIKRPDVDFRLVSNCSIDFHILSTLWIMKVGAHYDKHLSSNAYGNRLRRTKKEDFNEFSSGSFQRYLNPFRKWRDNSIKAMNDALDKDKNIISLTADVSSFYHNLDAEFMLDEDFKKLFNIELDSDANKLHRLFINAVKNWSKATPLPNGIPVGLPASAIIANLALIEFDQFIEQQVVPLYYGRYVDDIILVMEDTTGFNSATELWEWLLARSNDTLKTKYKEQDTSNTSNLPELEEIQFQTSYLTNSKIVFRNTKNKVFLLSDQTGKTFVNAIAQEIHHRASEWRALPNLPHAAEDISAKLVAATQTNGESADNLRKADAISLRRATFAITLRDFEAYERNLSPDIWKEYRHEFFNAFIEHILVIPHFFDLAKYLPRIIRLATVCKDFNYLTKLTNELESITNDIEKYCTPKINAVDQPSFTEKQILNKWIAQLKRTIVEHIIAAFPFEELSKTEKHAWDQCELDLLNKDYPILFTDHYSKQLFFYDLGHRPLRYIAFPKELLNYCALPPQKDILRIDSAEELLKKEIIQGIDELTKQRVQPKYNNAAIGLPHGFLFATRPFSLSELYLLDNGAFDFHSHESLKKIVEATRGYNPNEKLPCFDESDERKVLQIPDGKPHSKITIAVSNWHTENRSWLESTTDKPATDLKRYTRLNKFFNNLISHPHNARYFILPELALPAHWFMHIALKLQNRNISLISGIEYLHTTKKRVRNQVWAALTHDGLGFPSMMVYRQDKQTPALHEEKELQRVAGLQLRPARQWPGKIPAPPVIQHGNFRFAILICSELTNIGYRAALRGQIDALFVPEWNQDIDTFNALVESAALDIHAYIIQCNDRQYGDSRIRAPYKDSWKRDILRVKGGKNDYFVVGEIDIETLRRFQSSHRSTSKPFKPVPDGFEINPARKALPIAAAGDE